MRKLFIIVLCCTVIGLSGYGAYRGYKAWRQEHFLGMAREFFAKSDAKNAMLSLRKTLAANPRNIEATRLTAEVLEAGRSPDALLWRSLVVELNPNSTKDRLALAKTAMVYRDYSVATNALLGVSQEGKKTVEYQNIAGAVAASINLFSDAKEHFLEAARLEPQNPVPQLNIAVVDIHSTNEATAAKARATLQGLSINATNANLRCQALRELVLDAMRIKREDSALALSKVLLEQTNATFGDELIRLEVLRSTHNAEFKSAMLGYEREASTNSANLYELAAWQQSHGVIQEGLEWLQGLSPNIRTNQPAAVMIAEFEVSRADWPGLQKILEHQNWAGAEFIRLAFLSLAMHNLELVDSSKATWEKALKAAGGQKMSRVMLLRMAAHWGWRNETEDLLWTVVNLYPDEKWAAPALTQLLFTSGRTQSLMELFSQQHKAHPSDLVSENDLAMTALLLNSTQVKPFDLARDVYEKAPTNASFAATYAFSLWLQKKNAQALGVMDKLKPGDLERPTTSGYYALILQANGNQKQAKKYFDLSTKAMLLPEEQKLFATAKARG